MSAGAARQWAEELLLQPSPALGAPTPSRRSRVWWAVGDPQASFDTFAAILDRYGLLSSEGRLREDVGLLSVGDHFDYGRGPDQAEAGRDGERILRFLAAHPPEQAVILLGNHDTARVQELAFETDESFAEARRLAEQLEQLRVPPGQPGYSDLIKASAEFEARFPKIPTPGLARRDFSSFSTSQRALVQRLLLAGRFRLAAVARLPEGGEALVNHAGMTRRELAQLNPFVRTTSGIASALNAFLAGAVARAGAAWSEGRAEALDLSPLHVHGKTGKEGGGLLYHRASNPERAQGDRAADFEEPAPRRYSPRSLPLGLVQICGHAGHQKLRDELRPWVEADALAVTAGGLRTLSFDGEHVRYRFGVRPHPATDAVVYLIDGEMHATGPESYPLLRLFDVNPA